MEISDHAAAAAAVVLTLCFGSPRIAVAQADPLAEAKAQFREGMQAIAADDYATALLAFERANKLAPNPTVLANVALAQAALGRHVEALVTTERLLANPVGLPKARVARLQQLKADLDAKVGFVELVTNGTQGNVEVDGLSIATLPLSGPLRLAIGRRVVGVVATGFSPIRKAIEVRPKETEKVSLELAKLEGRPGQLAVKSAQLGISVLVDGQLVGQTPLPATVSLVPGSHRVRGERAGYVSVEKELILGEASVGEIELVLGEDASSPETRGGLRLAVSEPEAIAFVDDRAVPTSAVFTLPEGPHRLRVDRRGFQRHERIISVVRGREQTFPVKLAPTADYLAEHTARHGTRRFWGYGLLAGGGAVLLGSGAYAVYNYGRVGEAKNTRDAVQTTRPECASSTTVGNGDLCVAYYEDANTIFTTRASRQRIAYVGMGVGAVVAGAGAALILFSENPHRYDAPAGDAPYGGGITRWRVAVTPEQLVVSGAF